MQKLHNVDLVNARVSADDTQTRQAGGGGYQVTQLENENSNFDVLSFVQATLGGKFHQS